MILYYAMGGGMGHLMRTSAMIYSLKLKHSNIILLSNSPHIPDVLPQLTCYQIPASLSDSPENLRTHILQVIDKQSITSIFIDAFPCGILSELNDDLMQHFRQANIRLYHVARLLNKQNFEAITAHKPIYDCSYITEALHPEHHNWLQDHSLEIQDLNLSYPPVKQRTNSYREVLCLPRPLWLVVHSLPTEEVLALCNHAEDLACLKQKQPTIVVLTQVSANLLPKHYHVFNINPVYPLFHEADQVFTACGFNTMQQMRPFAHKHHFIPFLRHWDDQFERARRHRLKMK